MSTIASSRVPSQKKASPAPALSRRRPALVPGRTTLVARRLRALSAASFSLERLGARTIALDLSRQGQEPGRGGRHLASLLAEAGLAASADGDGHCLLDASFHDRVATLRDRTATLPAAANLGLALFLLSGIRGFVLARSEGDRLAFALPGEGLSRWEERLLEDRLAWLAANAVLVGPEAVPPSAWLKRLAGAFLAEFGD